MKELETLLNRISRDLEAGKNELFQQDNFIIKVYDWEENELDEVGKNVDSLQGFSDLDFKVILEPFFSEVLSGKEVTKIVESPGGTSKIIIVGKPLLKDGQVSGSLFLLSPVGDLFVALSGFHFAYFCSSLVWGADYSAGDCSLY